MHNKIFSADLGEIKIKAAYLHPFHTRRRQQLQFFPQAGEPGGRLVRREKLARMGLENHDASGEPEPASSFLQTGEHGLVAQMHAIEIAYGKRNRSFSLNRNTMGNTHDRQLLKY